MGYSYPTQTPTILASATSANGTAREGTAINIIDTQPGTLSFGCVATIVTGSVVATFAIQVSRDNTVWYDVKLPNNAAQVTLAATGKIAIPMAQEFAGWLWVRCNATLSGAATAAGDLTAITAYYVPYGSLPLMI